MICIYELKSEGGGPVLTKTPQGLVVLAFEDQGGAEAFVTSRRFTFDWKALNLEELGTPEYPMPARWKNLSHALRISDQETLRALTADPVGFPYAANLLPLPGRQV